jgi:SpoVK/Ycf46/Vps4 family AAA+-type ATPase
MRKLFKDAEASVMQSDKHFAIIFFDEIDAIAGSRSGGDHDGSSRRLLTELLVQLSALHNATYRGKIVIMAATNRPESIDSACLRRFETRLKVDLPVSDTMCLSESDCLAAMIAIICLC